MSKTNPMEIFTRTEIQTAILAKKVENGVDENGNVISSDLKPVIVNEKITEDKAQKILRREYGAKNFYIVTGLPISKTYWEIPREKYFDVATKTHEEMSNEFKSALETIEIMNEMENDNE